MVLLGPKKVILVVEDDHLQAKLLQGKLEANNYRVIIATDSDSVWKAIERHVGKRFDLIVLDVLLPDVGGLEILKKLKEKEKTKQIPVIVVSAKEELSIIDTAFAYGAEDFFTKPFDFQVLLDKIEELLGSKS